MADRIHPALERVLRRGGPVEVMRGAILSMARLEAEHGPMGLGLDHYVEHFLRKGQPENQESAIVALGVRGNAGSVELLRSLLLDGEMGRGARGGVPVGVRNRAFAAFALGLIGSKVEDEKLRLRIADTLLTALGADVTATREVQVATAVAVGLVPLSFCGDDPERLARHEAEGDRHLCGGVELNYLLEAFQSEELDVWLRAHAAPAMGRLAAAAPNAHKRAISAAFFRVLDSKDPLDRSLKQGCTIGLGLMADGDEDAVDVAIRKRLVKIARKGDDLSQRFALIGLAEASGKPGAGTNRGKGLEETRSLLLRLLAGGKGGVRPWAALGLGVLGHGRLAAKEVVSGDVTRALRHRLGRTKDLEEASACVLALGVLRDPGASEVVLAGFERYEHPGFRAYASLTLGLVAGRSAREELRAALDGAGEGGDALLGLAIGLRLAGDADVVAELGQRLRGAEEVGERKAAAELLGLIGNRAAITPLVEILDDPEDEREVRAAAAMALGIVCDADRVGWNVPLSSDVHYNLLTWTLHSPFGDGTGILDM